MELSLVGKWWLCLMLLGLVVLPATTSLFGRFADRGYAFAKICGLGAVALASFVAGTIHLLPLDVWALWVIVAALVAAQVVWLARRARPRVRLHWIVRDPGFWGHVFSEELVFLAAFVFWCWVRAHTPDLSGLEKPMDHGFVKAILDSSYLPAQDMWHSGTGINYYYFGQFVTAVLCRLTGIDSGIGYNLMVATTFAATVSASSALVYDLVRLHGRSGRLSAVVGGAISAGVVSLGGNGHAFVYRVVMPLLDKIGIVSYDRPYWLADATRYINCFEGSKDATIHEFPSYSFVVADLHAHMLDIMFVIVFIAFACMFVVRMRARRSTRLELLSARETPVQLVCMGVLLGIMAMTNYWDCAIYLVVSLFLVVYVTLIRAEIRPGTFVLGVLLDLAVLFVVSSLTSFAFTVNFDMISSSIALVQSRSPLGQWLVLWYPLVILFALYVVVVLVTDRPRRTGMPRTRGFRSWVRRFDVIDFFVFLLLLCALGLTVMPELIYVQDIYATAPRANTMFKFTYQAFILSGLALGYACARVMRPTFVRRRARSVLCGIVVAFLVAVPLVYAPAALSYALRSDSGTLDGLAYLDRVSPGDAQAVRWIDENTPGDAVVLEASGQSYTESCRISSATGRPTVLGWYVHEWLWRGSPTEEDERVADINLIYTSDDEALVRDRLEKYHVSYVFVGKRETAAFDRTTFQTLERLSSDTICFDDARLYVIRQ